jgi:hypothetical protein
VLPVVLGGWTMMELNLASFQIDKKREDIESGGLRAPRYCIIGWVFG